MVVSPFVKTLVSDGAAVTSNDLRAEGFRDIFSRLTGNRSGEFFEEYWEKHPVFFDRQNSKDNLIHEGVFSNATLLEIVDGMELPVDTNLSAVKYIDHSRQSWPFSSDIATRAEVKSIFKNNFTVQFYQPQRFSDELHCINAGFEHVFGSLAGASAYLTPANSQGLAPHHDDVDVFVLQCEGSKTWSLWPSTMSLPEVYSHDIPRSSLPGPASKVVMKKGDMLYLPRGTIHEALSQSKFSTHVTISVYQLYNMKKLLMNLLPRLLDSAFNKDIELRRGLPLWMSDKLGSFAGLEESHDNTSGCNASSTSSSSGASEISDEPVRSFQHSAWRRQLLEMVMEKVSSLAQEASLSLLDEAADEISGDFIMHRLPPPVTNITGDTGDTSDIVSELSQLPGFCSSSSGSSGSQRESKKNLRFSALSVIKVCDPRSMFCMVKEESGVSMLAMAHNRNNDRLAHMGHPSPFPEDAPDDCNESNSDQDSQGSEGGSEAGSKDNGECSGEIESIGDDESEEDEENGGEGMNGAEDGFVWSVYLPLRLAPIVIALQRACTDRDNCTGSFSSAGISLQALQKLMDEKRIFADEVFATVGQLHSAGFLMIVNDASMLMKSPDDKNERKNENKNRAANAKKATNATNATNNNIENGIKNAPERGIIKRGKGMEGKGLSISDSADRVMEEYFNDAKKPKKGSKRRVVESNSPVERNVIDEIKEYTNRKKKRNDTSKIIKRKKLRS